MAAGAKLSGTAADLLAACTGRGERREGGHGVLRLPRRRPRTPPPRPGPHRTASAPRARHGRTRRLGSLPRGHGRGAGGPHRGRGPRGPGPPGHRDPGRAGRRAAARRPLAAGGARRPARAGGRLRPGPAGSRVRPGRRAPHLGAGRLAAGARRPPGPHRAGRRGRTGGARRAFGERPGGGRAQRRGGGSSWSSRRAPTPRSWTPPTRTRRATTPPERPPRPRSRSRCCWAWTATRWPRRASPTAWPA
ncbi:hypothetical protein SMICM17S_11840 [Streptomyces microflavus]